MKRSTTYRLLQLALIWGGLFAVMLLKSAKAQTFPAQVNLNILPPYSPYLNDYLAPGQERIQATINFLDLNEPNWDAKVKLSIEGNGLYLETSRQYLQPITLLQGPNLLDASILSQLADFSKMDVTGMAKSDLVSAGRLPEGMYDFCLEVVDGGREVPLAPPGCFSAMLIQNNPPQLLIPECGATISSAGGGNLSINWIPLHDPSIMVEYQVRMVQVPNGMNVNDAINSTNTPILDWEPVSTTTFVYGPQFLPLENNVTYAFQVRVVDLSGLTTFENDGLGAVCWFTYGFSSGGTMDLTAPGNKLVVEHPDKVDLAWDGPSNAIPGQQLKYHIKVVKMNPGEDITNPSTAEAVMNRRSGVFYDDSTGIINNIFGSNLTVNEDLDPDASYAWQVWASTDGVEVARSPVWEFKAPPKVYGFWGADGSIYIDVKELSNYQEDSPTKFSQFTGTGEAVLKEGEAPAEVSFENLTIEISGNKWVLKQGEIPVPNEEAVALDFEDFGDGDFDMTAMVILPLTFEAEGQITWRYPLSVNAPTNSVVLSVEGRLNYQDFELSGGIKLEDGQSYDLLSPMGFTVYYKDPAQFLVNDGKVKLKLAGEVGFPENLNTTSGNRLVIPFQDVEDPWYFSTGRITPPDEFNLAGNSTMSLQPKQVDFDFSGADSPGPFSGDPEWTGAYFPEHVFFFPTDFDESGRISLTEKQTFPFKEGDTGFNPSWVSTAGINFKVDQEFESEDKEPYYSRINDFKAKFYRVKVTVEDNMISNSYLSGFIKIPLFGDEAKFEWLSTITGNGFQPAFLSEDAVAAMTRVFNSGVTKGELTLKCNQAVFDGDDRIKANVDINCPYLSMDLEGLSDFKIWGDGNIGFGEQAGSKDLPYQKSVKVGDFDMTVSKVGARIFQTQYAIFFGTQLSLPGGIVAQESGLNVVIASQDGEAPELFIREMGNGSTVQSAFEVSPIKISIDNSLIMANLYLDFYESEGALGAYMEGQGDVLVKQPDKIVAGARFIVAEKEGTEFWYARAYAQGLNKKLKKYPQFYMNGFDFSIYHHLAKKEGSALVQPNQFEDFWDLSENDKGGTINGNEVDANVALGMYGKIGLHDAFSGSQQGSGEINIEEELGSLALPLPEIPGFCEILLPNGDRLCDVNLWDFEWPNLDLCELKLPAGGKLCDFFDLEGFSICDLVSTNNVSLCDLRLGDLPDFPSFPDFPNPCDLKDRNGNSICEIDFPDLPDFCDLRLPDDTRLCDVNLWTFEWPNLNLCDLKLPGGGKLCDWFDLDGFSICDLKTESGFSLCQLKIGTLPDLPGLPALPDPCDLLSSNNQSLCDLNLPPIPNFCDLKYNGISLCDLQMWELPDIPPCDVMVPGGKTLCDLNIDFCDVISPEPWNFCTLTLPDFNLDLPSLCDFELAGDKSICDYWLPPYTLPDLDFCDLKVNGMSICDLKLWELPDLPPCDVLIPGGKTLCNLNIDYCDLISPEPWDFCSLRLPDFGFEFPNFCEYELPGGKKICDLSLPEFNIPEIEIPNIPTPEVPPLPGGLMENIRLLHFYAGLGIEVSPQGAVNRIAMDGSGWILCERGAPNQNYLARGFGGIEFLPGQNTVQFNMEGETGHVLVGGTKIKPICGTGQVKGKFTPDDWYVDVGTAASPINVQLGCISSLSSDGYLKARPSGIIAHGEIDRSARTEGGVDIEVADINFVAEAGLFVGADIGVSFSEPALSGAIDASAYAKVGMEVDPAIGDDFDLDFASVSCRGLLTFRIGSDVCMSGWLTGEVEVLGVGAEVGIGIKVENGNVSFPEDPARCD